MAAKKQNVRVGMSVTLRKLRRAYVFSDGSCGFGALGPAILRGPLQGPNDAVVYDGRSCYPSRLYESCHLVGNHSHIIITCSRIASN